MNVKLIESGFETNKPKYIIELAKKLFKKLDSNLNAQRAKSVKGLVSEEGLAVVLTKLHLYHASKDSTINLLDILGDPNFLYFAWSKIKEKGNKSPGVDDVPIQNIGIRTLNNMSDKLMSGRYKPAPAKRIYITNANGKSRPLGIPTSRDKVIQQALKIILEPLYEPHFSRNSHAWRPNKSCHTALDQIRKEWRMVSYFINLDLEKFFDLLGYKQIITALKRRCKDKAILAIVFRMLKVGYISLTNSSDVNLNQKEGIPQGSILSPLLSNIVLDEFDKIVENELIPKYNKRAPNERSGISRDYQNITKKFSMIDYVLRDKIKEDLGLTTRQARQVIQSAKVKVAQNEGIRYSAQGESTERLWYVRYADDFVFGYVGPKKKVFILTSEIAYNLSFIGVKVNSEKSMVVHHSKGIRFLSYNISGNYLLKTRAKIHKNGQRTARSYLAFSAPIKKLLERAKLRGFVMANRRGKINSKIVARRYDKWLFLQPERIVQRFKNIMTSIINYYQGCEQRSDLYELLWLYKRSCALTLAHHHKKRGHKAAISLYGPDLTVRYKTKKGKEQSVNCKIPSLKGGGRFKKIISIHSFPQTIEKTLELPGNSVPKTLHDLKSANDLMCHIPNCPNQADHWHHVKHRRKLKIKTMVAQRIAALMAKQIPVCKEHHKLIHCGKYNGPSLATLKGYNLEDLSDI